MPQLELPGLAEAAFYASPHAQLVIDPVADRALGANNAACKFFKKNVLDLSSTPVSRHFGAQMAAWIVFTQEVLTKGEGWCDTLSFTLADQTVRRVELAAKRIPIDESFLMLLIFQETEALEKHRERAGVQRHYQSVVGHWGRVTQVFREFERQNHLILESVGDGIYGVNEQGKTTFVNAAAERLLGWQAEELLGRNIHPIIHHSHRDGGHYKVSDCPIYEAFRDGKKRNVDNEIFWTKTGKPIEVEYTSTPIKDNGHLVGAVVVFRDVTQKRQDQRRLIEALGEVERLKNRLEMEKAYLQEEISSEFNHHKIVGKSVAMQQILKKIELVASTDATTLITGESGTGKELIARAIHELSQRRDRALIRVNCAAIPAELFEAEFFGHIKGAFTGAAMSRMGRFETADGGTLFLDEVGEIPLALQGKLLRVLQEQQFERVGESTTRSVDVRIIAATNQNLKELVKRGAFREDLYFRLNVFPIDSVPLRERVDDIPLLAQHFLRRAAKKANKPHLKIPMSQLDILQRYRWPGNIRELENVIERQVILAQGDRVVFNELAADADTRSTRPGIRQSADVLTEKDIKAQERRNIRSALKKAQGKVFGRMGAAELLDLKPTTLCSRMKKYGIDAREFK